MNAVASTKMNAKLVVLVCARPENNVSISMAVTDAIVTKDTHDKVRTRSKSYFGSKMTDFEKLTWLVKILIIFHVMRIILKIYFI